MIRRKKMLFSLDLIFLFFIIAEWENRRLMTVLFSCAVIKVKESLYGF
jgi:hypothetical protein